MPNQKIVACGVACLRDTPQGTEILFLRKRSEGREWLLLPGGKRRKREASSACARRELKEETGILVDELVHLGSFVGPTLTRDHVVDLHLYLLRQQPDWNRVSVKLSHEHVGYLWLTAGAALERNDLLPLVREVVKFLQGKGVV